ncbi:gluconokinase [Extensimonas vulgaris]|jgi:gluconokinase|uniref:Gluconokinase n=1 Tax=Extensimonas vulgaris TaxID=1031594 RepID=A0A369ARE4_9BURK|nr:gluconokinase [Extensimonas vulgaris]RCX11939.1 gluconate kinase (SKI family) [Extensimonas vulgaris]TWI38970.1 gluconokinase [Extensimonas vulgaris]
METSHKPIWLVVMGVAGCGKSSLGHAVATELGLPLIEGDDFHPESNIRKMKSGTPLTDADRAGWLKRLGEEMAAHQSGAVLTCSALKRAYRDRLRAAVPGLCFIFMQIDRNEAAARVQAREAAHIFPASLVDSQFQTLESPVGEPGVLAVQATAPLAQSVARVRAWLQQEPPAAS